MSDLELKVCFLPGTDFKSSVQQAKELAQNLNIAFIKYDFNGRSIAIGQNADIERAEYLYKETSDSIIL